MLAGDYAGLLPAFTAMRIHQFVLEYATPRAGDIAVVGRSLAGREIGLGVVNPRTEEAESIPEIVQRVDEALQYFAPEKIFLNPDCGFGCFANRCVNEEAVAVRKLESMVGAARVLRERSPSPAGHSLPDR